MYVLRNAARRADGRRVFACGASRGLKAGSVQARFALAGMAGCAMLNAGIARAIESVERRSEDLRWFSPAARSRTIRTRFARSVRTGAAIRCRRVAGGCAVGFAAIRGRPSYTRDGALAVRDGVLSAAMARRFWVFAAEDQFRGCRNRCRSRRMTRCSGRAPGFARRARRRLRIRAHGRRSENAESKVERVVVGRVALARFPAGDALERIDAIARARSRAARSVCRHAERRELQQL